jgi:photosystem II stability/assembly factor-like uncharacterized protein
MKKTKRLAPALKLPIAAVLLSATVTVGPLPVALAGPAIGASAVPSGFSPVSVTYVSSSEGWALGTVACGPSQCLRLLHTTDDGASWSSVPVPPAGPEGRDDPPLKVRFADPDDGWIFSSLPGQARVQAWSTHNGGQHWSAISFPVRSPGTVGIEDLEAAAGVVDAAVQVGDEAEIFSSPVGASTWHRVGGPYELGAGPVPWGEIALQGRSGWFVQNDRVVVSGGRHGPSGSWTSWRPPCSSAGGPVVMAASTASRVDAVCTEGVWTGQKITVDLLRSTNGGASFGPRRLVPVAAADLAAATGASTVAVGAQVNGTSSAGVALEMSFDNGASWQSVYQHAGSGWSELGFTTLAQGVAVVLGAQGHLNTMLFTRDGGRHWAPVNFR